MNIYKNKYSALLLAFFCGCSFNVYSDVDWDEFLKQPDKGSFAEMERNISASAQRCSWGNARNRDVVSIEKGQQLFKLVAKGDEFAFRAGLLVARCFDGGEMEDFYRSAGLFFEAQPSLFFEIAKENKTSESATTSMLTMLPLDTVDNIDLAIHMIENRIAILKLFNEKRFEKIRSAGLKFLQEQEEELNRIKVEMEIGKANQ